MPEAIMKMTMKTIMKRMAKMLMQKTMKIMGMGIKVDQDFKKALGQIWGQTSPAGTQNFPKRPRKNWGGPI
jgi:methanogenic corrinoid protein MtbC1